MKNILKHITLAAVPAALLLSGLTAAAQNYPAGSYKVVDGIAFNKSATDNHDGTYTVDLESFVTGKVTTETTTVPADVLLLLDLSSSMSSNAGKDNVYTEVTKSISAAGTRNAFSTASSKGVTEAGTRTMSPTSRTLTEENQGWTYANSSTAPTGTNTFPKYYKDGDKYYRVFYEYVSSRRRLYIMIGTVRWELWGSGIHTAGTYDPSESSSTSRVIYNGPLYSGGWKPYNITDGTGAGGHYYLYDGEYYPVRKEAAAQNYQPFVELPGLGKQYLTINGLASTIPTDNVGNYTTQYVGDLYTASPSNGWTYTSITTGDTDANTTLLYKHTDNQYYPVIKKTEGGIRQAYVVLPEGTRYLNPSGELTGSPYPNATTDNVVLYSGTLYKGGWRSYDITAGTTAGGHYLLYNGEYYPLIKETVNSTYQVYVNLPEGKRYLAGYGVSENPYPTTSGGQYSTIYFGDLYKSNTPLWNYSSITTGDSDANTTLLYKHTDNQYYPVIKKTEGGIRQAYVVLPEGTKYLNPSGNLSNTPYSGATADAVALYSGTLYKGGWRSYDIAAGAATSGHYLLYNGEYYPLIKETVNSTYQVYVNLPEGKRYLAGYGVSENPYPTTSGGQYSTIYFESLFVLSQVNYSRAEGLRRAVRAFITAFSERSIAQGLHHRLAMLEYNRDRFYPKTSGTDNINTTPSLEEAPMTEGRSTHIIKNFLDVADPANEAILRDAVVMPSSFEASSHLDFGLRLANVLFADTKTKPIDEDGDGTPDEYKRPQIAIIVGDGGATGAYEAAQAKALHDAGVTVFFVHVVSGNTYMANVRSVLANAHPELGSSYYSTYTAENYDAGQRWEFLTKVNEYDETLIDEIINITDDIGGAELEVEGTVVTVDVVSQAFSVPPSGTGAPQVFVAPLTGQTKDPETTLSGEEFVYYTFGTEIPAASFGGDDETITLTEETDTEGNKVIKVQGFDYSKHWCGKDGKSSTGYHADGYKLILRFVVEPNDDAVGGPEVKTNTEDSGIYVDGTKIATFNQPTVELPVQLWIQKDGLNGNDSAVFTIYYADPNATENVGKDPKNMTYQSFTKVVVNANTVVDGKKMVKITGLDSKFYYRIKEDAWAWTYDPVTGEIYTSEILTNPIIFENEAKETVKQAEAVKHNVFE